MMIWETPSQSSKTVIPPWAVVCGGAVSAIVIILGASKVSASHDIALFNVLTGLLILGCVMTLPIAIRRAPDPNRRRSLVMLFRALFTVLGICEFALLAILAGPMAPRTAHDIENRIYAAGARVDEDIWESSDACRSPETLTERRQCADVRRLRRELDAMDSAPAPVASGPSGYLGAAAFITVLMFFWGSLVFSTLGSLTRPSAARLEIEATRQKTYTEPADGTLVIDVVAEPIVRLEHKSREESTIKEWGDVQ
jgi:hypothetical protein